MGGSKPDAGERSRCAAEKRSNARASAVHTVCMALSLGILAIHTQCMAERTHPIHYPAIHTPNESRGSRGSPSPSLRAVPVDGIRFDLDAHGGESFDHFWSGRLGIFLHPTCDNLHAVIPTVGSLDVGAS